MSGTEDEIFAAQNQEVLSQSVQTGAEQDFDNSAQEAEPKDKGEEDENALTPAQKMDLLLRGHSPNRLKKEVEKLRKEAAKYRTSSKKEEEQKLALEAKAKEIQEELESLKNEHRKLNVMCKLDKAGCVKSELVAKDIPEDVSGEALDEFIAQYKEQNSFLFQEQKGSSFGGTFKSAVTKVLTPSQQMDAYIRAALGR